MKLTRRDLIQAGAITTGPWLTFNACVDKKPLHLPPKKDRAVIWAVFVDGNSTGKQGFQHFRSAQSRARRLGWKILDTFHAVNHSSKFLACMKTSLKYARDQETKLLCIGGGGAEIFGNNELYPNSLWIEMA